MAQMNFFDAYEANAKASSVPSTGFDANLSKPVETAGEEEFAGLSSEFSADANKPQFKIDVPTLLRNIDTDSDQQVFVRKADGSIDYNPDAFKTNEDGTVSWDSKNQRLYDEMYIFDGIANKRINIDDIDDEDAPFAVAAITHALFGTKSDYDGTVLSGAMKNWNKSQSKFNEGYNPETRTWDPKIILREFQKSWEYITAGSAEKKNALLNADAIANGWIKEGDKPFFDGSDSDEHLEYQFGIARKMLGGNTSMDVFGNWDLAQSRKMGIGGKDGGIDVRFLGDAKWSDLFKSMVGMKTERDPALFGFRDIMVGLDKASARALKTVWAGITGDEVGVVENGIQFHNADKDSLSDSFVLRRAAEELGVKSWDYAGLVKAIYSNNDSHSFKLKNGTTLHINEKNKDGTDASYIWIESGNDVEYKMGVVDTFLRQQSDSLGSIRMSHAINLLCGNKDAADGVAIYMAGRKNSDTEFWDNGDEEGLRMWANAYLDGDGDEAQKLNTVQTAFDAIRNMRQVEGFFGTSNLGRFSAAVGNLGVRFFDGVSDMGAGAGRAASYWVERGIDKLCGETPEERVKAHREHMVKQQVLNLVSGNWNSEGTVFEAIGEKILEFKAFELVFSARAASLMKPFEKIPVVGKARNALLANRKAEVAGRLSRDVELGNKIDDICDGFVANSDLGNSTYQQLQQNFRRMSELRAAKESQMLRVNELCGDAMRAAKIKDACLTLLNNTPNFFTVYASGVNDMEKADADRLAAIMDEAGTGFDDEMWSKAEDIIKGRGVVSTAFLMNLGRFLKAAKRGAVGNEKLAQSIKYIDDTVNAAIKNKDANLMTAIFGGMKVAKAELVEGTMLPMFKMGFGMGATGRLGENIEDAMLGIGSVSDIENGVVEAGLSEGTSFAATGAAMKVLPHLAMRGNKVGVDMGVGADGVRAAMLYRHNLEVARQEARPEDIISSYIAKNNPDAVVTPELKSDADNAFKSRIGAFIAAKQSGDASEIDAWRAENERLFGENGAKNIDLFIEHLGYSGFRFVEASLNSLITKPTAKGIETLFRAGGINAKTKTLQNGDIEIKVDKQLDATPDGESKISINGTFILRNGKIHLLDDNGLYNSQFARECVDALEGTDALHNPALRDKWNALTDEQKDAVRRGEDIDGILADFANNTPDIGWFGGKKEIEGGSQNTIDIDNAEVYDGVARLAGEARVFTARHELLGHGLVELLKKAKVLKAEDIKALEDAYGKNWEERLANDAAMTAGVFDAELIKHLIGDARGGILSSIREKARSFLRAIKVMKEAAGAPETFDVAMFIQKQVEEAHEIYKLHETQKHAVLIAKREADEAAAKASAEAAKARREAEELYKQNLEERKRTGQERAVQIAKQREVIGGIEKQIHDIALGFSDIDKFNDPTSGFDAKVERVKRDTIQHLKKLGMDKGEIGRYVENTLINAINQVRNDMGEMLRADRAERDAIAKAEEEARVAEAEARAAAKARIDAFHEEQKVKAQKKRIGEAYAKKLSTARKTADSILEDMFKALREGSSVSKFDKKCKQLMRHWANVTKGMSSDITKPLHDMLKENIYQSRKAMEYKADGLRKIEESRKAREVAKKEAERKRKEEERKREQEQKKALREAHRKEVVAARKKEADARQAQKDAELVSAGIQLLQMGMPVPNKNVVAGLKGAELANKREFMRQHGYYYSKDLDCWVNKKNAPKAFKKAATETVKESMSDVLAVQQMATELGMNPAAQEMLLAMVNEAKGRKVKKDPKVAAPKEAQKSSQKSEQKTEDNNSRALREAEDAIREMGALQGWDEAEIARQIETMRSRGVKAAVESAPKKTVQKPVQKSEQKAEQKPVAAKPIATVREAKSWFMENFTPAERLGLGIIEVDGKPWSFVYCAGEVISGNEQFRIKDGELPEGAVIRPFNKVAAENAIRHFTDESGYDATRGVDGELKLNPLFDYKMRRLNAQQRKETIERNKQKREDAARIALEQEALKAQEAARSSLMSLLRERRGIEEAVTKEPLDLEKLNDKVLAEVDVRFPFNQFYGNAELAQKRIAEIDAAVAKLRADWKIGEDEISAGIKNGHFCVSMKVEPKTLANVNKGVRKFAKIVRKDKELMALIKATGRDVEKLDDNALVWNATQFVGHNSTANIVSSLMNAIGVTSLPTKEGMWLQEYPETYRTREEWDDAWRDASKNVIDALDRGEDVSDINNFRLDYFLGEDSPLLNKFPWLMDIPVRFGTSEELGSNTKLPADAVFVVPNKSEPNGAILVGPSQPKLGLIAHEIQHAFQNYENQGFLGYYGYSHVNWGKDMSENQSMAVEERAWFDAEQRRDYDFQLSENEMRTKQTEFVTKRVDGEFVDYDVRNSGILGEILNSDVDGHFNVVFKEGVKNLIRFSDPKAEAERIVREYMVDFIGGPVNRAAHSILEMGFIRDKKRAIPNWLINQVIEQKGDDYIVTLDSGVKLRAILGGAGSGNIVKKLDASKEGRTVDGISGEIQWEYAGDKATIPHNFVTSIIQDNIALKQAKEGERQKKAQLKDTLVKGGVSDRALGKLEKEGLFDIDGVDVEHRDWYLSDFFPNDMVLKTAYPQIYDGTQVVAYNTERNPIGSDTPLFGKGQAAALGADGKIYVKVDMLNDRVRTGKDVQHTLVRDIGACLVKAIRREDGLNDDVARSPQYFEDMKSGVDFLSGKLVGRKFDEDGKLIKEGEPRKLKFRRGQWTNFGFGVNDALLRQAMRLVIQNRFEQVAKSYPEKFKQEDIDAAMKKMEDALNDAILHSFNDFYSEREAVMFANRFGRDTDTLRNIGEDMKDAKDGSVLRMDDPRYSQEEKSWSYINYYGDVLRKIDAAFGNGAAEHKDRSLRVAFERLMMEYMVSRRVESLKMSGELQTLLGYMNTGSAEQRTTVLQREGDGEGGKYRTEVVDSKSAIDELEAKEQAKMDELRAINDKKLADRAKPELVEACKELQGLVRIMLTMPANAKKKSDGVKAKVVECIKKAYPKYDDKAVTKKFLDMMSASVMSVKDEETPEQMAGRFNVSGGSVEENLVSSVAARIAWEKAKHRTGNISDMADGMTDGVKAQLMEMGVPEAEAVTLAKSILGSAKNVAAEIISGVDNTVTDAQIVAKARTKAANIKIGNDIYKSFRKGYKTSIDGETAIETARKTMERMRLRAIKRAAGFSVTEMNSMLGTDIIKDLMDIGNGGKYANGRELAEDMLNRYYQAYRDANPEMRKATNLELQNNDVFRADFAATISSWLVEAAKSLSYGQERELAIRDAARVKNSLPPTMAVLLETVAHHAEMLGMNLGKMSVEKTLRDIEKLIDSKPSKGGADGASAVSETARIYQREITPRLQQYWKYVKKAIWFDRDKVDAEIARLQESLGLSDSDVIDIEGKKPSEIDAEAVLKRDLAVMQINALRRYGALKERSAGEVMDVYMNDIAKDLAYAAEKFLTDRQVRLDEDAAIRKDLISDMAEVIDAGDGYDDISKIHQWGRRFYFWSVPDLFYKLESHFKTGTNGKKHIDRLRQEVSLAHINQMRLQSEYQKQVFKDIEEIYGESFSDFIRHACLPDEKYDRFSRAGWAVPENGGVEVEIPTGRKYAKGDKEGKEITRKVTLAVEGADPTRRNKHLSLSNLIYIYAACRQPDMAVNNIVFSRDAAYIADLERTIGAEGIALADRMVRNYTALRELVSPVSERITGMPVMSPNELYVPLEFIQDKKSTRVTRYEINPYPKFLLNRKYHDAATLDESVDFLGEYFKRSEDAAHYAAFGELADRVRTTIGHDKVVTQYHNLIGSKSARAMFKQLNDCFNGGVQIEDSFGTGFRNFVTATTLGYNPSSCLKQLEGIGGWALEMGPIAWAKMCTFDKVFDRDILADALNDIHASGMFEKHGLLWERSEGISEPMIMLMNARNDGTGKALNFYQRVKEGYKNHSMDMIRFFDSIASNWGAGSYYASRRRFYEVEQGLDAENAKRLALADTDYAIQIGQQSARPEFLHEWQREGVGGRFLTQFVGPTIVRAGVEIEALHRHFLVERTQESFNRLFSKLIAGHIICPSLLVTVSQLTTFFFGNRDDKNADIWDDFSTNLLISMAVGPMSGVVVFGQIADAAIREAAYYRNGGSYYRRHFESPVTSKLGKLADGLVRMTMDSADTFLPLMTGQDLNPAMLRLVSGDVINILRPCFPQLQVLNAVKNVQNYKEKLERDERRRKRFGK